MVSVSLVSPIEFECWAHNRCLIPVYRWAEPLRSQLWAKGFQLLVFPEALSHNPLSATAPLL